MNDDQKARLCELQRAIQLELHHLVKGAQLAVCDAVALQTSLMSNNLPLSLREASTSQCWVLS
jgi:hypothetical protein